MGVICSLLCSCGGHTVKEYATTRNDSLGKTPAGNQSVYVDLEKAFAGYHQINAVTIQVKHDQYFNGPKKYKAYHLVPLIDSIIKSVHFDTAGAIIVFTCVDGYSPSMKLSKMFGREKPYLVFKNNHDHNESWPDVVDKKFYPFYLVWDNAMPQDAGFVWPYGLTGFRLTHVASAYRLLYPVKNSTVERGFNLYLDNCAKCHSINKTGGTMGPELNVPKNITEYWKEEDIISFVKKPGSYRYNSHMPAMGNLTDPELKEIVRYFKYMKANKQQ